MKGVAFVALGLLACMASALADAPRRIVTLTPHLTEFVYAAGAGDRIVGTLDTSDYPPAARRIPRIGDVGHIDAERLLALKPDLVIVWGDGSPAEQRQLLKRLGLPVLVLEQHALADVPATLETLGRVLGTESVATAAAAQLRAQFKALEDRYARSRHLRVFYQVWSAPLYTVGAGSVATEMLRVCGAQNIYADQAPSAFAVDEESVYARAPDVVAFTGTRAENADWLKRWAGRAPLPAIAAGRVISLEPDLVNRMGPRLAEGTRQLCERLDDVRRGLAPAP
jgi:iron complex transport system substrate-binding protein